VSYILVSLASNLGHETFFGDFFNLNRFINQTDDSINQTDNFINQIKSFINQTSLSTK